ncbi:DUF4382 domain-containing protein [Haloarchaeobius sp. DT45]|uniref:DUF4382 domain-containing protein n=1 Tax=Haloarchaeobius sp. DT45 TaxID=3446116 RepID=UPI003F6D6601
MTRSNVLAALAMAALLVTAGCMGATVDGTQTAAPNSDSTATDGSGSGSSGDATMSFYVSDRPGAIEDFEHLNVTITEVGLRKTGDIDGSDTESSESENETGTESTETESTTTETETATDPSTDTSTETSTMTAEEPNETTVMSATDTTSEQSIDAKQEDDETDNETDGETETETAESETESDESESEDGWTTHTVDKKTVDLTELKGANASKLANFSVESGEYDKVFVYVSNVEGTLKNGEKVNVKLPSGKLQINKAFTVQQGEEVDFVFDIMIHKAGNSGKYVLRPVIGESGTGDQVEIDDVDDESDDEDEKVNGKDEANDGDDSEESESATELTAELQGQVKAGETVTLTVTNADGAVEGANVTVNGELVGETDADGTFTIDVPDVDELEVTVTNGDAEAEIETTVKGNAGNGNGNGNNAIVTLF